jgi:hypothetical protein
MKYELTHAYCLSGLKSAAVFHDIIEPTQLLMSEISTDIEECVKVMGGLHGLESHPRMAHKLFAHRISQMHEWLALGEKYATSLGYPDNIPKSSGELNVTDAPIARGLLENASYRKMSLRSYLRNKDIENIYWKLLDDAENGGSINVVHGIEYADADKDTDAESHPSCILANIDVVNPELLTWEQIVELRKDVDSINALRSLKLFVYENFNGKPLSYIEDKLNDLLCQHQDAVKSWGFKTSVSCIDTCVSKDNILSLGALSTAIFGAPLEVAAAAGAAATLGKIFVTLHDRHNEKKNALNASNVKYLWNIKELAKPSM